MITSVHLLNFKPFANQLLEFKNLTLFSGLNSTGKSSVMQSLLLLRQSYQQGLLPEKCYDKLSESYWSLMPYPKIGQTERWIWRSFLARYLQRASQGLSSLESN